MQTTNIVKALILGMFIVPVSVAQSTSVEDVEQQTNPSFERVSNTLFVDLSPQQADEEAARLFAICEANQPDVHTDKCMMRCQQVIDQTHLILKKSAGRHCATKYNSFVTIYNKHN